MDKIQAIKASKAGAIFAFISAGVTAAVVLFVIFTNPKGDLEYWNDPWIFLDAFFILICGIGILRHSRAAAVIIFVYFILTKYGVDARRRHGYVDIIKYNLRKAAYAQRSYFDKNNSYKSCAPCAARDLPGYNNNPKVTLVAEIGRRDFVLVATHERCGDSQWIYQRSTGKITGPNAIDSCKWRP